MCGFYWNFCGKKKKNKRDVSAFWKGNILISHIGTFDFFFLSFRIISRIIFFFFSRVEIKILAGIFCHGSFEICEFSSVRKSKNLSKLWKITLSLFSTSNYLLLILVFHNISVMIILGFYRWEKCFLIPVWSSPRLNQPVAKNAGKTTLIFVFILLSFYVCYLQVCF